MSTKLLTDKDLSTDITADAASDAKAATPKAVKVYADAVVPSLPATQIAFGDGDGKMTGSGDFIWDQSTKLLQLVSLKISHGYADVNELGIYGLDDNKIATYNESTSDYKYGNGTLITNGINVGINTSAPSVALDVVGAVNNQGNVQLGDVNNGQGLTLNNSSGGLVLGYNNVIIQGDDTEKKLFLFGQQGIIFHTYGYGNFTGTPTYSLQVDGSGNVIEEAVTKKYPCQLYQFSENPPYDNILLPQTFAGNIAWSRVSEGVYNGFFTAAFPQYKTAFRHAGFKNGKLIDVVRIDDDNIQVSQTDLTATPVDGLHAFDLLIEVYPDNQLND